jgi:hypothetical protein
MPFASVLGPAFSVLPLVPKPARCLCDMLESLVGCEALTTLDQEFEAGNWL